MYPGWVLACGCLAAAPAPAVRPVPCSPCYLLTGSLPGKALAAASPVRGCPATHTALAPPCRPLCYHSGALFCVPRLCYSVPCTPAARDAAPCAAASRRKWPAASASGPPPSPHPVAGRPRLLPAAASSVPLRRPPHRLLAPCACPPRRPHRLPGPAPPSAVAPRVSSSTTDAPRVASWPLHLISSRVTSSTSAHVSRAQ